MPPVDSKMSDLVADVIHELRTPLVPILGYAEMLIDGRLGPLQDRQKEGVAVVLRNAQRMDDLISQLLDLARLESGRLQLEMAPVDLAAVAREVVEASQPAARQKSLDLQLEGAAASLPLRADPVRIKRVLSLLVSDAVRSTESRGSVTLKLAQNGGLRVSLTRVSRPLPEAYRTKSGGRQQALTRMMVESILAAHQSELNVEAVEDGSRTETWFVLREST
jgi:signal transduction histidine kinase